MLGKDQFSLSKPREIKTFAKSFTDSIKKTSLQAQGTVNVFEGKFRIPSRINSEKIELDSSKVNEIGVTIKNGSIKLEVIRPYAKHFLEQVSKVEEIIKQDEPEKFEDQLIFSYSDNKGRWGKLENNGNSIKITLSKKSNEYFEEEQINIYSLSRYKISPSGIYIQVKGWGNLKELSVLNALKNSISKLPENPDLKKNERIIFSYSLSSMQSLSDGGWECRVKVIPGKISKA